MIARSYEIKRSELFQKEKKAIKVVYDKYISNDKIFPGGQKLIDSTLMPHLVRLKAYYQDDSNAFNNLKDSIAKKLVARLRNHPAMDSLFHKIRSEVNLGEGFGYAIVLKDVSVTFDAKTFIPIMDFGIDQHIPIGGEFRFIDKDNIVSSIAITANSKMSNRVAFTLYVGNIDTNFSVLRSIFPLLLLSGCCIIGIVWLYLMTYSSWIKQKRMAEMASDFINNVTHEFNTPLTTIRIGLTNLVVKVSKEDKLKMATTLDTLMRQVNRLDRLINKAIDLSVFNQEEVILEEHFLEELMVQLEQDLGILVSESTVIQILMDENVKYVKALVNPFMFVTAVNNLVDNGLKYNKEPIKCIHIRLSMDGVNTVMMTVHDNGIGISHNQLPYIFTKGYRGKQEASSNGLGLGLFFVKEVMRIHRWKINVKSGTQSGTTFSVSIPIIQ
ncbi:MULTISPECIES: sensor histidine kinase [Sphingobacterium]|uniref:sensor histidine kinase n=1 Tax=Sphingobacterium TaxID=28453 RepID=UPI00257F17EA|nr:MULTISPECIES: HAMP domain-containing sensor histidine kinase [Sphingobacterium]